MKPHHPALRLFVHLPLFLILIPLLLLLVPLFLVTYLLYGIILQIVIWVCWCSRGTNVLLVYSDSPNWYDDIEAHIIARLPPSTVLLNWSQRREWKYYSLRVMAFRFFGGSTEFNPLVVVFRPFHWAKTFRFWKPYKDCKHGEMAALKALKCELFDHLSRTGIWTAT